MRWNYQSFSLPGRDTELGASRAVALLGPSLIVQDFFQSLCEKPGIWKLRSKVNGKFVDAVLPCCTQGDLESFIASRGN